MLRCVKTDGLPVGSELLKILLYLWLQTDRLVGDSGDDKSKKD